MTTLWQRGMQWCRKSKPKLEASVVVRVDSPRASGRPLTNTHCSGAALSAHQLSKLTISRLYSNANSPLTI